MARIQCGSCGGVHASVAEVRACHRDPPGQEGLALAPEPAWADDTPSPDDRVRLDDAEPGPALGPGRGLRSGRASLPHRTAEAPATPSTALDAASIAGPGRSGGTSVERPIGSAAALAGPEWLGRNLVVAAGGTAPPPWAAALWVDLGAAADDPAGLVAALWPRWHTRQRIVFELPPGPPDGVPPFGSPDDPPDVPPLAGPVWEVAPTHMVHAEVLHHLIWANSVDGRDPERPGWPWAEVALALGATPASPPGDGDAAPPDGAGEVVLPDGTAVWCDGGPPTRFDPPVLHRIALERGGLDPLGPPSPASPAAEPDLAPDQRATVSHPGGAARIIAPAGSGKTRVLTERARLLLGSWRAPASATCLVAFNKRAADEMIERTPDLRGLQVRTLNALGLAILDGRAPFRARTDRRHPTLDERQVRRTLDGLNVLPRGQRRANTDPLAPWLEALSTVRLGLRDPAEVEAELGGEVDGLPDVVARYRGHLAERHELDFDEQVVGAIEVLLREPETRRTAQRACRLLLVDEFQDLTPAHLLLVRLLASPDLATFGVGDDDQTIYGYTGATPEWLIGYDELFPGAGNHPLEVNYRCPPAVVTAVGRLLAHNRRRVAKVIRPRPDHPVDAAGREGGGAGGEAGGRGDGLTVVEAGEGAVTATVEAVATALAGGARPGEVAVLTRVNASLAPVQVALAHAGIPARPAVDERWLERTGVRAALGWLRLATDPGALRAADVADTARRPGRGLSVKVVEWMAEQRSPEGLDRLASRLQRPRDAEKVTGYAADLRLLADLAGRSTTEEVLRAVRDRIGLDEAMDLLDGSQRARGGSAQADDLDALVALARLHPAPATFAGWLRQQLTGPSRQADTGGDGLVLLSTVHAVKGREWPQVVVHEATAGLFPHRLAADTEEERRVFHVAVTRASRQATVVAGSPPSPFVAELQGRAPAPPAPSPRRATPTTVDLRSTSSSRRRPGASGRPERGPVTQAEAAPPELVRALKAWRAERARRDGVPAYVVFPDSTLARVAAAAPRTLVALSRLAGIGPAKLDRYGDEVLAVLEEALSGSG